MRLFQNYQFFYFINFAEFHNVTISLVSHALVFLQQPNRGRPPLAQINSMTPNRGGTKGIRLPIPTNQRPGEASEH